MKTILTAAAAVLALAAPAFAQDEIAGDVEAGEKDWKKCKACHAIIDADGETIEKGGKTGPNLWGIVGRQAGTDPEFGKYTDEIVALGEGGLVWSRRAWSSTSPTPRSTSAQQDLDDAAEAQGRQRRDRLPGAVRPGRGRITRSDAADQAPSAQPAGGAFLCPRQARPGARRARSGAVGHGRARSGDAPSRPRPSRRTRPRSCRPVAAMPRPTIPIALDPRCGDAEHRGAARGAARRTAPRRAPASSVRRARQYRRPGSCRATSLAGGERPAPR